jgi:putative (di)nucleoside polyphosphate hydrolase
VIDREGYRPNVGIIVCDVAGQVLWAKRIGQDAWQFPQGGIDHGETAEDAMYRELHEELGLKPEHVKVVGVTRDWLRYRLPKRYVRRRPGRTCIGQKQRWFALRLLAAEELVHFDAAGHPEFDGWRWVDYWYPLEAVVPFKREVYRLALEELAPSVLKAAPAPAPPMMRTS